MKKIKKFVISILLLIIITGCFAKDDDNENQPKQNVINQYSITSLDSLIFKRINKCKIVMIGDAGHGNGYFMSILTNFLSQWVDSLSSRSNHRSIPLKIALFLEDHSEVQNYINSFIETGNIISFLTHYIDYDHKASSNVFTADYFIFINELRNIKTRIDKLNKRKPNHTIDLKIVGAESNPPYTFHDIINMKPEEFKRKRLLWYAFERDKKSSKNIDQFLVQNPDYKGIVFYGGAHLKREKSPKNFDKELIKDDLSSYYLAHYLDSLFTRDKISTFNFVLTPNMDNGYIQEIALTKTSPDFIIYSKPIPLFRLTLSFVKSKTYFKSLYDVLLTYSKGQSKEDLLLAKSAAYQLNNQLMRTYIYQDQNVLGNIDFLFKNAKIDFKHNLTMFLDICNKLIDQYDVIKSLEEVHKTLTFNHYPDSVRYNSELRQMLVNISSMNIKFNPQTIFTGSELSLNSDERQEILEFKDDISNYLAIHWLFLSTPAEKNTLIEYLKKKNHVDLNTEREWMGWWYKNYN